MHNSRTEYDVIMLKLLFMLIIFLKVQKYKGLFVEENMLAL